MVDLLGLPVLGWAIPGRRGQETTLGNAAFQNVPWSCAAASAESPLIPMKSGARLQQQGCVITQDGVSGNGLALST
jgi:hypothetical protein